MQHTDIDRNNKQVSHSQGPGQENKDTKEEETDHEGNSRSSICQIIKWTFQVENYEYQEEKLKQCLEDISSTCAFEGFQKQECLYTMDCVVRELGKAEASVPSRNRQPKLTLKHTSSHNTSPVSLRIPFRSEYKAALTNEF